MAKPPNNDSHAGRQHGPYGDPRGTAEKAHDAEVTERQLRYLMTEGGLKHVRRLLTDMQWHQEVSTSPGRIPFDIVPNGPLDEAVVLIRRGRLVVQQPAD